MSPARQAGPCAQCSPGGTGSGTRACVRTCAEASRGGSCDRGISLHRNPSAGSLMPPLDERPRGCDSARHREWPRRPFAGRFPQADAARRPAARRFCARSISLALSRTPAARQLRNRCPPLRAVPALKPPAIEPREPALQRGGAAASRSFRSRAHAPIGTWSPGLRGPCIRQASSGRFPLPHRMKAPPAFGHGQWKSDGVDAPSGGTGKCHYGGTKRATRERGIHNGED